MYTPLWTRSIKFEPQRKKDQSADTNTPPEINKFLPYPSEKKRKDQRMPMHTTPQKWLFQTPSKILVHRGVCTLNGMAHFKKYSSSKCKQTVCLHYGLDFHFKYVILELNVYKFQSNFVHTSVRSAS
jgi:hypothetical protein